MHDIVLLVQGLQRVGKRINIETSGTLCLPKALLGIGHFGNLVLHEDVYLSVAPKQHYLLSVLDAAREIRVVVNADTQLPAVQRAFERYIAKGIVWLSPINEADKLTPGNENRAMGMVLTDKRLRLNLQAHKVWGVR